MGMKSNQPYATNIIVARLEMCRQQIIVIAENAQAHGDQPALFSNETHVISLLTAHEVSRGDADALIVCRALEFAQNGQTVTVVAEDTGVLILLVYHWIKTYSSERKAGSQDREKSSSQQRLPVRNHLFIHACSVWDTTSATYGHGKMYLMEIVNLVSEVHNLPSIVSDRDAPADEVGFAGIRLFCLLFLVDVELKRIH